MLKYLKIKNYALIEDIEIEVGEGLTTITGETGAGKSIILGAISLLAGNRADRSMLKYDDKKCIIEASFKTGHLNLREIFERYDIDFEEETIIRREFTKDGKSRVFVNDSPTPLLHLKEIMNKLLDVHSQHENLELNNRKYQLNAVDLMAGNERLRSNFQEAFHDYLESEKNLLELRSASAKLRENTDLFSHQLNELTEASLEEGEQDSLESEIDTLSHAEEIKANFYGIEELFNQTESNPISLLNSLNSFVRKCADHFAEMSDISARMGNLIIELDDIRREIERLSERFAYDPERLQIVQDRLSLLYQLQQKFKCSNVKDLIEKRDALRLELSNIENLDERLDEAQKKFEQKRSAANKCAKELSESRFAVLTEMEEGITNYLKALGMSNSRFKVDLQENDEMTEEGYNKAEFLFSANKGVEVKPISKVASGGELSRLMLSIKALLTSKTELPTIIFDEIDTGISGVISEKMGRIIREMCRTTQVMAITHLPQLAAMGDHHMVVYKDEMGDMSKTKITEIDGDDRTMEIARLLSGEQISQEAMENAKVLLSARD